MKITQAEIAELRARGLKHCPQCVARGAAQTSWPIECFANSISTKDGKAPICRTCGKANTAKWVERTKAKNLALRAIAPAAHLNNSSFGSPTTALVAEKV